MVMPVNTGIQKYLTSLHSRSPQSEAASGHERALAQRLPHVQKIDLENQRGVGRNGFSAAFGSVTERRRNREFSFPPDFHPHEPLIPTTNNPPCAESKR